MAGRGGMVVWAALWWQGVALAAPAETLSFADGFRGVAWGTPAPLAKPADTCTRDDVSPVAWTCPTVLGTTPVEARYFVSPTAGFYRLVLAATGPEACAELLVHLKPWFWDGVGTQPAVLASRNWRGDAPVESCVAGVFHAELMRKAIPPSRRGRAS